MSGQADRSTSDTGDAQTGVYSIQYASAKIGADQYFVPEYARSRPACQAILSGQYYEPMTHKLIGALLEKLPGDMIHAGAFFGDMLPSFAAKCQGTVYAFEPVLENFILSKLCVQANGLTNVVLQNAGLGDRVGSARIDTGGDESSSGVHHGGASHISESGQLTALLTIDGLGLSSVSIIQLDVEGYELNALKGAAQTLIRRGPIVMIEDNSDNCAPFLKAMEYHHMARIPGLNVWATSDHAQLVRESAQGLKDQNR